MLTPLDISIFVIFFAIQIGIGFWSMRRAGKSSSEFFLSGRTQTWWLLGFSLVATTFAADTPNFVTQVVRQDGVSGNWCWWAFLLTGMTTVFLYAKLWRRLGVMTDIEFYETRYDGKSAAFLRGFRTVYLGLICNMVVMANVTLAIIKILGVVLGVDPWTTLIVAGLITMLFCTMGGFTAVLWADFVLFIISMAGAVIVAVVVLAQPEVGGLTGLLTHPNVTGKLSILPDLNNWELVYTVLLIPLVVQWWSVWYPGSEPGGGSFGAQRMLAAKSEGHAVGATFFFNFCHYAVRPWPWIIAALGSLILYPDLEALKAAAPANLPDSMIRDDIAYPMMIKMLQPGLFGIVLVSLFAAYMSTIASLLNLGSSYMVNDFYKRFVNPGASEKQLVFQGRIWTVIIMILSSLLALFLTSAKDNFDIILSIGAGTGLLFLLRWFWWRINAWSEIAAMCIALPTAIYFHLLHVPLMKTLFPVTQADGSIGIPVSLQISEANQLLFSVALTTVGWLLVTYMTKPTGDARLREFVKRTAACGPGWSAVIRKAKNEGIADIGAGAKWPVPLGLLCSVIGCVAIYGALFAAGYFLYGQNTKGIVLSVITVVSSIVLWLCWRKLDKIDRLNDEELNEGPAITL